MMKMQRAKEQNDRLDAENRALRERVRTLESEKKNLLDQVSISQNLSFIEINPNFVAVAWHCLVLFLSSWQRMKKMLKPKRIERTRVLAANHKTICWLTRQTKKKITFTNGK